MHFYSETELAHGMHVTFGPKGNKNK